MRSMVAGQIPMGVIAVKHVYIFSVALLVGACSDNQPANEQLYVPPELVELRQMALRCSRDAQFAPVEHSEHCVIVAEAMFEVSRGDCEQPPNFELTETIDCFRYDRARNDIYLIYHGAIAEGLFNHGKSPELEALSDQEWFRSIYFQGEIMRSLFDACLEREAATQKIHFIPATSIPLHPLQEGQMCFRQGYPTFPPANQTARS